MRQELSIAASTWLAAAPIPIASSASVLTAFVPGTAKVVRFRGPHRLYRAAGWDSTKGKMASATPAGTRYYLLARNGSFDRALTVATQPGGKIVAAGLSEKESTSDLALVRYNNAMGPWTLALAAVARC